MTPFVAVFVIVNKITSELQSIFMTVNLPQPYICGQLIFGKIPFSKVKTAVMSLVDKVFCF